MSPNDSIEEENVQIVDISEFFSTEHADTTDDQETSQQQNTYDEIDSPIKELKAILLSLDWEITDEIADSFINEVDRLSTIWNNDKVVVSFLQILRALGKYLRTHKANAHPESVNLLYSVYNHFEKIVLTDEISPEQEQSLLDDELHKFENLKKKIAAAAKAASEGRANDSLLSALKGILLEIDWQITDQTMAKFNLEISSLEKIWRTNKIFLTPLQMMRAIGAYINKNKQDSHPDSIKLLNDVFETFEQISLNDEMSDDERQKLINQDLERFSLLKEHISAAKSVPAPPAAAKQPEPANLVEETGPPAGTIEMPGQLSNDDYDTGEIDLSGVVPIDADPVADVTPLPGSGQETEVTAAEVGNRLDDLFENITPLPEEDAFLDLGVESGGGDEDNLKFDSELQVDNSSDTAGEPSTPIACHTVTLQRIINAIGEKPQAIDLDAFTAEAANLRGKFPDKSSQETILQIITAVSTYREVIANHAHPDSGKLLLALGADLCQTEKEGFSATDCSDMVNSALKKYLHFQNSIILTSMQKMQGREKQIKGILGLTS